MLAVPILGSTMTIIMRQIRKMSVITISSYSAYTIVFSLGIVTLFTSNSIPFYTNFKFIDWAIIAGFGVTTAFMQFCRTRAVQHEEPAKVVIVNYSGAIMQLIADLIFFNVQFSMVQALGITITMGASFVKCGFGIKKTFYS